MRISELDDIPEPTAADLAAMEAEMDSDFFIIDELDEDPTEDWDDDEF